MLSEPARQGRPSRAYPYPRQFRLTKTDEFSSVFGFRRVYRGVFFTVHYQPTTAGAPRLGLVIAKKLVKQSVRRNLLRRLCREAFRGLVPELPSCDVIVRLTASPWKSATGFERKGVSEEIRSLLLRVGRKVASQKPSGTP